MTSYLSTWSTKRAIRGHGHRVQVPSMANVVSLQFATLWWGCQCSRQTGSVVGGESVNIPPYASFVFKRFLQDLGPDVWRMYIHKMMLSNFMGRICIWQTHKIMCTSLRIGELQVFKGVCDSMPRKDSITYLTEIQVLWFKNLCHFKAPSHDLNHKTRSIL